MNMHIVLSNRICSYFQIKDHKLFLFGNIAPDCSIYTNEFQYLPKYETTHFIDFNNPRSIDNYIKKYLNGHNFEFYLGYFCHLYIDYCWKREFQNYHKIKKNIFYIERNFVNYTFLSKFKFDLSKYFPFFHKNCFLLKMLEKEVLYQNSELLDFDMQIDSYDYFSLIEILSEKVIFYCNKMIFIEDKE